MGERSDNYGLILTIIGAILVPLLLQYNINQFLAPFYGILPFAPMLLITLSILAALAGFVLSITAIFRGSDRLWKPGLAIILFVISTIISYILLRKALYV